MTNAANLITVFRIALVPVFLVLAYLNCAWPAFAVYVVACVTDMLDGYVARRYNQVSSIGKFMDPLADKILVLSVMCWLVERAQMPGWFVALILFREFAVSGLRLIALEKKRVIAACVFGKVKTVCTMICLGAMLVFGDIALVNIISCVIIAVTTVFSGIQYFIANKAVFEK